jgi:hypothetical protein
LRSTSGGIKINPHLHIHSTDAGGTRLVEGEALPRLQSDQKFRRGHLDYIDNACLQFITKASSFLGMRQLQAWIDSLHAEVSRAMLGGSPRKTTSFLCFQTSQHRNRSKGCRTFFAILGGVWVFHISVTLATPAGFHPMLAQKLCAKVHAEKMWSAVSSAALQISQVASSRMCLQARAALHCILTCVSSHPKNFTRGGAKFFQTKV